MAPPNQPQIARITYQMHKGTRVFENTFHLARAAGWSPTTLATAVDAAFTLWNTWARPALTTQVALYNVHGVVYDPLGFPYVYDHAVSPELPGTLSGASAPGNVSLTVSERANLAGRKFRGRMYWPAIPQGNINTDDSVNAGIIALLASFSANFLTTFNSGTGTGSLSIFHRNSNTYHAVASIVLEAILDSMRRRLPGRGV